MLVDPTLRRRGHERELFFFHKHFGAADGECRVWRQGNVADRFDKMVTLGLHFGLRCSRVGLPSGIGFRGREMFVQWHLSLGREMVAAESLEA